jgi:hypothetical protein
MVRVGVDALALLAVDAGVAHRYAGEPSPSANIGTTAAPDDDPYPSNIQVTGLSTQRKTYSCIRPSANATRRAIRE